MSPEKILTYLTFVPNQTLWLNALNHLLVISSLLFLIFGKTEKTKRLVVDGIICLLFTSIVAVAVAYGNPFHAITMGLLAVFAGIEFWQGKNEFTPLKINTRSIIALLSICIGFWYPEFVEANSLALLLFSPVGIVPCPTLLVVLGLLTLAYPRVNKTQYTITALMGAFYGITGVFQLKVMLDLPIIIIVAYAFYSLIKIRTQQGKQENKNMVQ